LDIGLDPSVAVGYRSLSQKARVITEHWASGNLYCTACPCDRLEPFKANTKVVDFRCPECTARYQVKSKSRFIGNVIANSAYGPKMDAIASGQAPNYIFLCYSPDSWMVTGLFAVPGHFLTPAIVHKRPPLKPTARRSGWVGSNILLGGLPPEARVALVTDSHVLPRTEVRRAWDRFAFLALPESSKGGWGADTLMCLRRIARETGSDSFSLQEFYRRFEHELGLLHPENRNVRAKIRQQLQILRDNEVIRFLGRGDYRVV